MIFRNFEVPTPFEMNDLLLSLAQMNGRVTRPYVLGIASAAKPMDPMRHITMIPPSQTDIPAYWIPIPGSSPTLYANENLFVGIDRVLDQCNNFGIR
jgi:hypothetical protein